MERYSPTPDEIKQTPEAKKKPAIWRKFVKYTEIAALSALLSMQGIESAFAQEKGEKEDAKTKIEQLRENAAEQVKIIVDVMKVKGQEGELITFGNKTPLRRWVSPDRNTETIVGYTDDESKARWLTHDFNDGSERYFDDGADGSIDRIIFNKDKISSNNLLTFKTMEDLADEASIMPDFNPKDIKVLEINSENGNFVLRLVDYQSGEFSELSGSDAAEIISELQAKFTNSMESLKEKISK